jgi:hypothetical protein
MEKKKMYEALMVQKQKKLEQDELLKKQKQQETQMDLVMKQQELIKQLEFKNRALQQQNEVMLSAQKSPSKQGMENSETKNHISYITLDDDIEDTPCKEFIKPRLEESSYLPMNIAPPEEKEKKKIVKRVRFFDDDAMESQEEQEKFNIPPVGSKRSLIRHDDVSEDFSK